MGKFSAKLFAISICLFIASISYSQNLISIGDYDVTIGNTYLNNGETDKALRSFNLAISSYNLAIKSTSDNGMINMLNIKIANVNTTLQNMYKAFTIKTPVQDTLEILNKQPNSNNQRVKVEYNYYDGNYIQKGVKEGYLSTPVTKSITDKSHPPNIQLYLSPYTEVFWTNVWTAGIGGGSNLFYKGIGLDFSYYTSEMAWYKSITTAHPDEPKQIDFMNAGMEFQLYKGDVFHPGIPVDDKYYFIEQNENKEASRQKNANIYFQDDYIISGNQKYLRAGLLRYNYFITYYNCLYMGFAWKDISNYSYHYQFKNTDETNYKKSTHNGYFDIFYSPINKSDTLTLADNSKKPEKQHRWGARIMIDNERYFSTVDWFVSRLEFGVRPGLKNGGFYFNYSVYIPLASFYF